MLRLFKWAGVLTLFVAIVAAGFGIHKARWAAMRMQGA